MQISLDKKESPTKGLKKITQLNYKHIGGKNQMEEKINQLHELIKKIFPDAVSVRITVNAYGIEVDPSYKTNINSYSMRTLTGQWVVNKEF
jgi:predicted HD phosphohydrolase